MSLDVPSYTLGSGSISEVAVLMRIQHMAHKVQAKWQGTH